MTPAARAPSSGLTYINATSAVPAENKRNCSNI